ncbi:hypothetical protein [Polaribacter sp. Hel1_85]|uniref:hypothetical protein n=1 Tax=Polaribacter sp. Hel1_85 TaxID=1250005 RepID=UPI00052B8203|nr:hypothetical protein [Polaribacter sp. Hel1_85]KGL63796.1 hypothetical protein PHEL85_0837 [Polaribacter sp. Hel1_85]
MKNHFIYASLVLLLFSCNPKKSKKEEKVVVFDAITAEQMPTTLASGQKFPTDSTTINNWVKNSIVVNNLETNTDIITHGWDLWDALTTFTDQENNGQKLRRFETWYTPADIITALRSKTANKSYKLEDLNRSHTGHLKIPHQNSHGLSVKTADVLGFVKCDPTAANHIFNKELYYFEVLKSMIQPGKIANIPAFPASSVLIKPVFQVLTDSSTVKISEGKYKLPVWPGYHNQIPMSKVIAKGFGPDEWNNDITITTTGTTDAANKVFSVKDFIHFKINKAQAEALKGTNFITGGTPKAGQYAVLIGMHLNTRENKRWTWQTFWWSENPTAPQSPSSSLIASQQPASLEKAAKHYAMGLAYNMISPAQPYSGGSNAVTKKEFIKESIYAFNPYLEAGFSVDTFNLSPSTKSPTTRNYSGANDTIRKYYSEGYQKVGAFRASEKTYVGGKLNQAGIETNCMSCHGQARMYDVAVKKDAFQYYAADQYYDMNAPYFKNTVVLDFAWSIQGNLINKETTAKK